MKSNLTILCLIAITIGLIPGCSRGPATGTVSGNVTFGDAPLTKGKIVFVDDVAGVGGSAVLDENGHYAVTGKLPVGTYKIYFANSMKSGSLDPKDLVFTPVKTKYKASGTSGLTFEIKKNENVGDFSLEK